MNIRDLKTLKLVEIKCFHDFKCQFNEISAHLSVVFVKSGFVLMLGL